jgi:hypothetical protein
MSLVQQNNVALDTSFQGRVRQSVYRAALAIVGEDWAGSGMTAVQGGKRHSLGVAVLSSEKYLQTFYRSVSSLVGDVADESTISDSAIDTAVDSSWDDVAGVKLEEK